MNKEKFKKNLESMDHELISVIQFGSYGTCDWVKGRSDIDIAIVLQPKVTFEDTLNMEDNLEDLLKKYYSYDKIHITFIFFKDFASKFARIAVESDEKIIIDECRWYDFQHYVLQYARKNRDFERMLKIDEQYTYFGGIIDESIL